MHHPKRVTIIVEYFPPRLGADRRIFELTTRLSKDYKIDFVILPPAYTLFIKKIDNVRIQESTFVYEHMVGHQIGLPDWLWKLWGKSFVLSYILTLPYLVLKILQKLVECKSDVVLIKDTSAYAGFIGTLSCRLLRKTSIVDFDDLKSSYSSHLVKSNVKRLTHLFEKSLIMVEDFVLTKNRKVTTLSHLLMSYAAQRGVKKRLFFVPDGVDTSLFDPSKFSREDVRGKLGISESVKLCVYAGRIDENMGGEILFQVARSLNEKDNAIRFLIVGEGDPSLVKRLSELNNTILTGRVPAKEMPRDLAAADLVLVPYPNKPASHAASPLKLFEGLAMEKPVIAADVNETRNIVLQETACILLSDDPKDWISVISKVAHDYDHYITHNAAALKNGRKHVQEKYDWSSLSRDFGLVINSD